ncbi:MAG: hypothetical protein H6721_08115 [Sandaracinus sp.]|nr:hypothetical protein [Sandaracinus sp.]MCB9632084.1 hypothetical protein [Sandaracinus sp.]
MSDSVEISTFRSVTELRFELRDGDRRATWIYDPRETGLFFVVGPPVWDDGTPMGRDVADALYARVAGQGCVVVEYQPTWDAYVLRLDTCTSTRPYVRVKVKTHPEVGRDGAGELEWLSPGRTARVAVDLRRPASPVYEPTRLMLRPGATWLDDGSPLRESERSALASALRSLDHHSLLLTSLRFVVDPASLT